MLLKKNISFLKIYYIKHKKAISLVAMLIVLAALLCFSRIRFEDLKPLISISPQNIVLLIISSLFFRLVSGYNFKILMLFFNIRLSFKEWFGLTAISTMTNYLFPVKAGMVAQAAYLKKRHLFSYTHFLSSFIVFLIFAFLVNSFMGVILSLVSYPGKLILENKLFLLFSAVSLVTFIMLCSLYFMKLIRIKWHLFQRFTEGAGMFFNDRRNLFILALTQAVVVFSVSLRFLFAFWSIGISINIVSCAIIALIVSFSLLFSITPANMGIKEFFVVLSSKAVGITAAQGIMVALIDRGIDMIASFITGGICSYLLAKDKTVASLKSK